MLSIRRLAALTVVNLFERLISNPVCTVLRTIHKYRGALTYVCTAYVELKVLNSILSGHFLIPTEDVYNLVNVVNSLGFWSVRHANQRFIEAIGDKALILF